jgi:hypothetical protein
MLRFKDMMTVEYLPGEDELVNYRAYRRKRTIGVGEGGPIGEETEVDEALSIATRLKKSRDIRRNKAKIQMGKRRAARRFASKETLEKRARRAAYKAIYNKIVKNIPRDELTPVRKSEIETRLSRPSFKNRIERLAVKMIKDVRKKEMERKNPKAEE